MGVFAYIGSKTITPIQNSIRTRLSPALSTLYARIGFVDRNNIAANLKALQTLKGLQDTNKPVIANQTLLIKELADQGILKWRFNGKITQLSQLEAYMLYGRIDNRRIDTFLATHSSIAENLLKGIVRPQSSLPGKINAVMSTAFRLGAISALAAGYLFTGATLGSGFGVGLAYIFTAGLLGNSFSPNSAPAGFFRLGKKLFPVTLVGTALVSGYAAYNFISERFYPRYVNTKEISVTCADNRVNARVCEKDKGCTETELIAYQGKNPHSRACESAESLQAGIDNNILFDVPLEVDGNRIQIPRWRYVPSWFPYSRVKVLNLSGESYSGGETREDRIAHFFDQLWSSGIMPSSKDLTKVALRALEAQMKFRLFRDPRLKGHLDLASLYFQMEEYDKALEIADKVINFNLSVTTGRPVFYDEAVFLKTEVRRIQAMKFWKVAYLNEAVRTLVEHQGKLKNLEDGYKARYNLELLITCTLSEQFFPKVQWENKAACLPENIERYRHNATFRYNSYTPAFSDNFLAVRAFVQAGKYHLAAKDLAAARSEYEKALALLDLIDSCSSVAAGNAKKKWAVYKPYMKPVDRKIGEKLGRRAGLKSFAARCNVSRALRRDIALLHKLWGSPKQFTPRFFKVFRAQIHQGLAGISTLLAEQKPNERAEHLARAKTELQKAYALVQDIRKNDVFEFYTALFEERQAYYEVLTDFAWNLYNIFSLDSEANFGYLVRVEKLAKEVARHRTDDPSDILYLKSTFLLAEADQINLRNEKAAEKYQLILLNIQEVEENLPEDEGLNPHYTYLKELAATHLAVLKAGKK